MTPYIRSSDMCTLFLRSFENVVPEIVVASENCVAIASGGVKYHKGDGLVFGVAFDDLVGNGLVYINNGLIIKPKFLSGFKPKIGDLVNRNDKQIWSQFPLKRALGVGVSDTEVYLFPFVADYA